jgi:CheY-like chemotaxis protein
MRPVLIVDDNPALRELLACALELSGYEVRVARDGHEALAAIASTPPSAMVVDFRMPDISGVEVISRARATPGLEDVCAILASCELPEEVLDASVEVLQKPFAIRRLVELLRRHGVPTVNTATQPA